jgi:hypothetical protein
MNEKRTQTTTLLGAASLLASQVRKSFSHENENTQNQPTIPKSEDFREKAV